jgi:hypothetical protein
MKARLKPSTIIQDLSYKWVRPGQLYEAEWSEKMISPEPVVLLHPDRHDVFCELPFAGVEIIPDDHA